MKRSEDGFISEVITKKIVNYGQNIHLILLKLIKIGIPKIFFTN